MGKKLFYLLLLLLCSLISERPTMAENRKIQETPQKSNNLIKDSLQIILIRKQVEITTRILRKRLETILPIAMKDANIDMWIILCQEDNLDPVYKTMIPMDTWPKVLQMLVFFDRGKEKGVERINLSMTNTGDLYDRPWRGGNLPQQWQMLAELIEKRDPKRIGINIGSVNWADGGLTYNLYNQLIKALPEKYITRITSAEKASTRWGMTLTEEELEIYPHVSAVARHIISRCFSTASITPGKTTCADLDYLFWQICSEYGLELSFKPYFTFQRSELEVKKFPMSDGIIRRGDIIICDVGIRYLGLFTDHQEIAYIRHENEKDAPQGLKNVLAANNRLQEIFMQEFKPGLSGNELLQNIFAKAKEENIPNPRLYSHSLGLFVHQPGPVVGYPWEQKPVQGRGELKLEFNSCYAMELAVMDVVPEWGNDSAFIPTEQIVMFTENGCKPIDKIQKTFYLL